jgi:hypothetical protein
LRERTRFHARRRRRRQGIPERNGGPYRIRAGHHTSGYSDLVPAEPFAAWLRVHLAKLDAEEINTSTERGPLARLAMAAEVDVERLRRFAKGTSNQSNVTLGFVDRVMIASGTSTGLWELYPE